MLVPKGLASGTRLQQELDEFQKARAFADQLYSAYAGGGKSQQSGAASGAGAASGWDLNSAVDAIYRRVSGGASANGPGGRTSDETQPLFTPRGGTGAAGQSFLRQATLRERDEMERGYASEQERNGGRRTGPFEKFDTAAAAPSPTGWSSVSSKPKHRGAHRATRLSPASMGLEDLRRPPPPPDWLLAQPPILLPPPPPPAAWGPVGYPPASPGDYSRLYAPPSFGYSAAPPPAFGPLTLYQPAPSFHSLPPPSPRQQQAAPGYAVEDREARAKAERLRFLEYQHYLKERRRQLMAQSGVDPSAF